MLLLLFHALVLAQVEMNPTADGAPGAAIAQKALNWLGQYALWGSLAAILIGACTYGLSQRFSNSSYAVGGRVLAIGGVVGAILTGLGPGIINLLFKAASAGGWQNRSPAPVGASWSRRSSPVSHSRRSRCLSDSVRRPGSLLAQ